MEDEEVDWDALESLEKAAKPKTALQAARQIHAAKKTANPKTTKGVISVPKSAPAKIPRVPKVKKKEEDDDMDMGDGSDDVTGLEIANIDFVATSAKDMRDIEEKTAQNEENLLSTVKAYKKNHIQHLYRFTDDVLKPLGKTLTAYPKTCDKKCLYCHERFTGIPIFPPHKLEKPANVFVLTRDAHCSPKHAKLSIILRNRTNWSQQVGLLGHFLREFFGLPDEPMPAVPLSARTDFSYYGTMSEEEYASKENSCVVMVKEPPVQFVETFLEEHDIKKREEERRKVFNKLHTIRATPQQQSNYKENIERVVRDQQKVPAGIESSPIGKKMGMTPKKKNFWDK